jgi:epoxyqueuosine reductase QueG
VTTQRPNSQQDPSSAITTESVTRHLTEFVTTDPGNNLGWDTGEPSWAAPLVGVARGDDPLFAFYKEHIGEIHWTPEEVLRLAYPDASVRPETLSVVVWVLPQTEATKAEQRFETESSGERWARSRNYGEVFNARIRAHMQEYFAALGLRAVAPVLRPEWGWRQSDAHTIASNWSERHAAYAAGLGTFSLNDGLITAAGIAMRCGSVVVEGPLAATPRPYSAPFAYCLYTAKGKCGACIGRCPAGAITKMGHDKTVCHEYVKSVAIPRAMQLYGVKTDGCGLCQSSVPCESCIPAELRPAAKQ